MAQGLRSVISAELQSTPMPRAPVAVAAAPVVAPDPTPILERNPFDSETGSLTAEEVQELTIELEEAYEPPSPTAPTCKFAEVTLIVASDPAYAFASIKTPSDSGELYKIGDPVADAIVHDIAWDRVWFEGSDGPCQLRLGDKLARKAPPPKKPAAKKGGKRKKKQPVPVPEHISSRIQQLGPYRYAIERSAFDAVFQMENGLVRGTKVRPVKDGDRILGMSFNGRGVAEGSLLHSIGIRAGDVLKSVNGFQPTNPQKALEAYGRLKTADNLSLVLEREGQSVTIDYQIQ